MSEKERSGREREADAIDLSVERTDSNAIERLQLRPPDQRIYTSDVNRKIDAYKKVLALVVSGLPLTWNRSRTESEEDEAKAVFEYLLKSFTSTRSIFLHWKDELIMDVKTILKNIISRLQSFAICNLHRCLECYETSYSSSGRFSQCISSQYILLISTRQYTD